MNNNLEAIIDKLLEISKAQIQIINQLLATIDEMVEELK